MVPVTHIGPSRHTLRRIGLRFSQALSDTVDMSGASNSFRPAGEMAAPHLPSLEALALAIEAQGSHDPDHLLRARFYALQLARRLGMDQAGLEALELAAILHDVGELAVPQSILSKPGDLTPPEFEKMKTHAPVGAR